MSLHDRIISESIDESAIPEFKKVPRDVYDLACPYCEQVMGEKDHSFKFDTATKLWEHCGKPIRPTAEQRESAEQARAFFGLREDRLPGGKGDKLKPSDVDQAQLRMGIEVEMEHTKDRRLAREIALDHLAEDPKYYTKLKKVHREGLDEGLDEGRKRAALRCGSVAVSLVKPKPKTEGSDMGSPHWMKVATSTARTGLGTARPPINAKTRRRPLRSIPFTGDHETGQRR